MVLGSEVGLRYLPLSHHLAALTLPLSNFGLFRIIIYPLHRHVAILLTADLRPTLRGNYTIHRRTRALQVAIYEESSRWHLIENVDSMQRRMRKLAFPCRCTHHGCYPWFYERVLEYFSNGWPFCWIHLKQIHHQPLEFLRVILRDWIVLSLRDLQRKHGERIGIKGRFQQTHLQQYNPKRPNISLEGVLLILADLRRHVIWRPNHTFNLLDGMLEMLGYAEISQFDCVGGCEEDVLGLEVTVDYLAVVDVLDRQADLGEPGQDLLLCEYLIVCFGLADALAQVSAFCVTHDDVEIAILALERPQELDDEVTIQCLQNMRLSDRFTNLSLCKPDDLNLFEHALLAIALIDRQVTLSISPLTQDSYFPVIIQLHSNIIQQPRNSIPSFFSCSNKTKMKPIFCDFTDIGKSKYL